MSPVLWFCSFRWLRSFKWFGWWRPSLSLTLNLWTYIVSIFFFQRSAYALITILPDSPFRLRYCFPALSPSHLHTFCPLSSAFRLPHSPFRLRHCLTTLSPSHLLTFYPISCPLASVFWNLSSDIRPLLSDYYTGIGAITWDETNIQVTSAALSVAPR